MKIVESAVVQTARPSGPLWQAAVGLEGAFLSEMLKSSGLHESGAGSDGAGASFQSFLRQEQAAAMAEAGGIGLAESLFLAMVEREK